MVPYYHASGDGSIWESDCKWEPFASCPGGWKSASELTPVAINCTSPEMALQFREEFMKALVKKSMVEVYSNM